MNKHHELKMAKTKYPGGLRIIECETCRYAFAIEVDQDEVLQMDTRIPINEGELEASHSYFQAPDMLPSVEISVETRS